MSNYHERGSRRAMRAVLGLFAGLVLLGAVLASCTQTTSSARPKMVYATAQLAGDAFIAKYEARHGSTPDPAWQTFLIERATVACTRLVEGADIPTIWQEGVDAGMSSDQSATVIEYGIEVYCPVYLKPTPS